MSTKKTDQSAGKAATKAAAKDLAEVAAIKAAAENIGVTETPPEAIDEDQDDEAAEQPDEDAPDQEVALPKVAAAKGQFTLDDEQAMSEVKELDRRCTVSLREHMSCFHQIGGVLFSRYGAKERLDYGRKIMREIERRWEISASELYRALKWYRLCPDFDRFCAEYPKVQSWSAVKELLPALDEGAPLMRKSASEPVPKHSSSASRTTFRLCAWASRTT